jgi:hypothetical protein
MVASSDANDKPQSNRSTGIHEPFLVCSIVRFLWKDFYLLASFIIFLFLGEKKKKEKPDGPLDVLHPMRAQLAKDADPSGKISDKSRENSDDHIGGEKERKSGKLKSREKLLKEAKSSGSGGSRRESDKDKKRHSDSTSSLGSASNGGSASSSSSRLRADKDGERKKHKKPHKNLTMSEVSENHLRMFRLVSSRLGFFFFFFFVFGFRCFFFTDWAFY